MPLVLISVVLSCIYQHLFGKEWIYASRFSYVLLRLGSLRLYVSDFKGNAWRQAVGDSERPTHTDTVRSGCAPRWRKTWQTALPVATIDGKIRLREAALPHPIVLLKERIWSIRVRNGRTILALVAVDRLAAWGGFAWSAIGKNRQCGQK